MRKVSYFKPHWLLVGVLLFGGISGGAAQQTCHGRLLNPITDLCWSCLFPITIGPHRVISGKEGDTRNPKSVLCSCGHGMGRRVGLALGFWEPISLVDVTRTPFCFVNLGGWKLDFGKYFAKGNNEAEKKRAFYQVHWYHFPLLSLLKILTEISCMETGDWDLAYLSELDPLWHDDLLSFILNPEAILFGAPNAFAVSAHWAKLCFGIEKEIKT